jgi:hypothetical protein
MKQRLRRICAVLLAAIVCVWVAPALRSHEFHVLHPQMQQLAETSPSLPCSTHPFPPEPGETLVVRWSTVLDANAAKILTQDRTADGKLGEIESVIQRTFALPMKVNGAARPADSPPQLTRIPMPHACGIDGLNSICFAQADMAFTPGVLAITRVVTADRAGIQLGSGVVSTQAGQVLETDIYINPSNSPRVFATPAALTENPKAYDLESVLLHERESFPAFRASTNRSNAMSLCLPVAKTFSASGPVARQQP